MKKIILFTLLGNIFINAQYTGKVGINTNTPNTTLTVEGGFEAAHAEKTGNYTLTEADHYITFKGASTSTFTLPACTTVAANSFSGRIYKIKNISNVDLTLTTTGSDIIRNTNTTGTSSVTIPAGYYVEVVNSNGGASWDLSFLGHPPIPTNNWVFDNIYDYTATAPQTVAFHNTSIKYTPLTGFSQNITIPAGKQAKVIITYSIPAGANTSTVGDGYFGVTLYKDGTELSQGSRKSTSIVINPSDANGAAYGMTTISTVIADNISASASAQTINYSLSAYTELMSAAVIYNMFSNSGPNYNWGRGYWSFTVFLK